MKRRVPRTCAVWVWYDGRRFWGYQTQPGKPTVESALRAALAEVLPGAPLSASGRTDKGVHARMQVLSFRVPDTFDADALKAALAARLPEGLGVHVATAVDGRFHAHWSASGKRYRYRLLDGGPEAPDAWSAGPLGPRFAAALGTALGSHDFIAFHEKSSARRLRTVTDVTVHPYACGDRTGTCVHLEADGFARYQVRYLVGSAVKVARGELAPEAYAAAVQHGAPIPGLKAPAHGLTLWEVLYPAALDPFADARNAGSLIPGHAGCGS